MNRAYRDIIGTQVLHYDEGTPLALVTGLIVHPDTGHVEALWVKPLSPPLKNAIIQTQDILEWKKHLYVRNETVVADPADVIRITDILEDGRGFLGKFAQGESGASYGRVYDLDFDDKTFYIKQVHTHKGLLGLFFYSERSFSLDSVVEVLPDKIIVNDDSTKKEALSAPLKMNDLEAPPA